MKLIDEIIEILSSENCNLENALIKTKILLHKMGEKSLLTWVNQELNGYDDTESVPDYRKIQNIVVGSFQNYTTRYTNHPIPIMHLKDKELDFFTIMKFSDSISTIEHLSKSDDTLYFSLELEFAPLLTKTLVSSLNVTSLKRQVAKSQILGILTQIRSRLLDFILDISEKIPEDISDKDIKSKSKEIDTKEIFNNAIFDGNITINIGDNNKNKSIQIKNNFENLLKKLKKYDLNSEDLNDLKESIKEDKTIINHEKKEFGKNVKSWLQNISTKIRDKVAMEEVIERLHEFYGWIT
ncbi:MAG: hypothetical protein COB07_08620 [Sulfurovum sp.]|nr:MAG: hypothetical protein COB07_08620 [Sulfurovum sp.]